MKTYTREVITATDFLGRQAVLVRLLDEVKQEEVKDCIESFCVCACGSEKSEKVSLCDGCAEQADRAIDRLMGN